MILVQARAGAVPFALAVQNAYFPASAAEFPNDNPGLHQGVRWVCRYTLGAARALLRAQRPRPGAEPLASGSPAALACLTPKQEERVLPELPLDGPLELDLGRIVLAHRVENVPPPPAFIYRPFVSSRARELRAALGTLSTQPLELLPYRVVDQRAASRRVQRGWRVDVAPCVSIAPAPGELPAQPSALLAAMLAEPLLAEPVRQEASVVAVVLEPMVLEPPVLAPPVLAPPLAELARPEPARTEPVRRARRRGAALAARALSPASAPGGDELERAISDLENAFAERPWGHERRRSPRGSCTSLSSAVLSALSAGGI